MRRSYSPGSVPHTVEALVPFLGNELQRVSNSLSTETETLAMEIKHKEPANLFYGLVVAADGVDWNPGSGGGVYIYWSTGVWVPIVSGL